MKTMIIFLLFYLSVFSQRTDFSQITESQGNALSDYNNAVLFFTLAQDMLIQMEQEGGDRSGFAVNVYAPRVGKLQRARENLVGHFSEEEVNTLTTGVVAHLCREMKRDYVFILAKNGDDVLKMSVNKK